MFSATALDEEGEEFDLYGEAGGFVQYQASGRMVGVAIDLSRPRFETSDFRQATDAEMRSAFEGFVSYEGTYELDVEQSIFTHQVVTSSHVNLEGASQVRPVGVEGDVLTLTPPAQYIGGKMVDPRLSYRREVLPPAELPDDARELIGVWRVRSAKIVDASGAQTDLLGESPRGFVSYDECGRVASTLASSDRPPFATGDFRGGTNDEIRRAFTEFITLAGTYSVDASARTITHSVELAMFPNWQGAERTRGYELNGATLVTIDELLIDGRTATAQVEWTRESRNAID
jgi:hypothetical protein